MSRNFFRKVVKSFLKTKVFYDIIAPIKKVKNIKVVREEERARDRFVKVCQPPSYIILLY